MNKIWALPTAVLIIFLTQLASCQPPTPEPFSQSKPVPSDVQVTSISDDDEITPELTQTKVFDQCASSSPFKAEIKFSQMSGQATQQELILGGEGGGEVGLSEVAKLTIKGKIESHFSSIRSDGQGHEESVLIEVPPGTKQQYTVKWQEIIRKGIIEYIENNQNKSVDYSYRIGVEFVSSTVADLPCPTQEAMKPRITPAQNSPKVTVPVEPKSFPPNDTPVGSVLQKGETWISNGVQLTLEKVEWSPDYAWGGVIDFWLYIKNNSNQELLVSFDQHTFSVYDNLGNNYESKCLYSAPYSFVISSGRGRYLDDSCTPIESVMFAGNFFNTAITQITLVVKNLSRITEAQWVVDVPH